MPVLVLVQWWAISLKLLYTVHDCTMDLFGDLPPPSKPADSGELLDIK